MKTILSTLLLLLMGHGSASAADLCRTTVNATDVTIDRAALGTPYAPPGRAARRPGWSRLGVDRITGHLPACDSATLIAHLSREVPADDLDGYCLLDDATRGHLLVPGRRDVQGRCANTTCDRVNSAVSGVSAIAGTATDIVTGRDAAGGQSRASAVIHASGTAILTGSASQLLASLGAGIGTATTAALAAPAIAGAAAVSVVTVGGAVFLCR